jgi:DNA gyrase inhibitor GyrI
MHTNGREDRRTDMTKLIVAFRNFANAPKNSKKQRTLAVAYHNPEAVSSEAVQCRTV